MLVGPAGHRESGDVQRVNARHRTFCDYVCLTCDNVHGTCWCQQLNEAMREQKAARRCRARRYMYPDAAGRSTELSQNGHVVTTPCSSRSIYIHALAGLVGGTCDEQNPAQLFASQESPVAAEGSCTIPEEREGAVRPQERALCVV